MRVFLILTPILFPIATRLGIDPIHLGIIMVVNMEIRNDHAAGGFKSIRDRRYQKSQYGVGY
jgi:TRAP-type mannitol/chloroaromatic compound transport system permease large subunit